MALRHITLTIVDAKPGLVRRFRLGINQQAPVRQLRTKPTGRIHARSVKGLKIVLGKELPAMGAPHFPGMPERIDFPVVHRRRLSAGRAEAIGPDHPGAGDAGSVDHLPDLIQRIAHPGPGLRHDCIPNGSRPGKLPGISTGSLDQLRRKQGTAALHVIRDRRDSPRRRANACGGR